MRPRSHTASLATLALITFAGTTSAQKQPPSSLRNRGTVLRFSHIHERVTRCSAASAQATCEEKRAKAGAATDLTLTPLAAELVSEPTESRQPQHVTLPAGSGSSSIETRVDAGHWALSWMGQRAGLQLAEGRPLNIRLTTTSGRCVRLPTGCKREDDFVRRQVNIPPEFQAGE